jgi:hypothetical protein
MKDYPSYRTLKYYFSNVCFDIKNTDDLTKPFECEKNKNLLGSLVVTEFGDFFFTNSMRSSPILPDELDTKFIIPYEWLSVSQINYILKYYIISKSPDLEFKYFYNGNYTSNLYKRILSDIRTYKIDIINGDIILDPTSSLTSPLGVPWVIY